MLTQREKARIEAEALREQAIRRLSNMKAEDIFPEKNKRALESLIHAGLLKKEEKEA